MLRRTEGGPTGPGVGDGTRVGRENLLALGKGFVYSYLDYRKDPSGDGHWVGVLNQFECRVLPVILLHTSFEEFLTVCEILYSITVIISDSRK